MATQRIGRLRRLYWTRVYAIASAVLTLALTIIGLIAVDSAKSERKHLEEGAMTQSREAVAAIEREVIGIRNVLVTLGGSPFLETGDLQALYQQAVGVSHQVGVTIVLRDSRRDEQVLNTAVRWGASLDGGTRAPRSKADDEQLRAGTPIVTNVFFGKIVSGYFVSVIVPVFRAGELCFFLSAGIPLQRFADLLQSLDIRDNETISITDGNGLFVARSLNHEKYAATRAFKSVPATIQSVVAGKNREGMNYHAFNRHSDLLGWSISTVVPDRILDAPMVNAILKLAAASAFLFVATIALVYLWGRRALQSLGTLGIDRRPSREEFEVLFDSAPNGVMVVDDQGRIVLLNVQAQKQFEYSSEELIGQQVEMLIPERFRTMHTKFRHTFALDRQPRPMGAGRDLYGRRKNGTEFAIEVGLNPIQSGGENLVMITVVDISARKLAEDHLNATRVERDDLRRRFVIAQEQERLRLAHELHDQTGQSLTAVMLEIRDMESTIDEPQRARFRFLRGQLEQMGRTLHHVAWELRPASIDELGLSSALANYVAEWGEKCGVEADFQCVDLRPDEFSEEISTTIYRVAQEALTNVAKHAKHATSVGVVLERLNGKLQMTIDDDGCGFDPASTSKSYIAKRGLGIAGMRERLLLIGAELEIESSIGLGTTIYVRIPLEATKAAA